MDKTILQKILEQFGIVADMEPYGNGHINDTYLVSGGAYILQRINTSVFLDAEGLMENVENVTVYLREKIRREGGDPEREALTVIPAKDGKTYYKLDDQNVYRVLKFIGGTCTIEGSKTPKDLYEAGAGFGHFQKMLSDYPAETLHETIVNFHHTPTRVEALKEAVRNNLAGRAESVKEEIAFALENASWADTVVKGMKDGSIPVRVTHNDTKIDNILFDEKTGKALCVIDLDTVMSGSMLYDFGDALRMGGSSAAEDEADLEKVWFETAAFEAFAKGYLSEMRTALTKTELELLPFSVKLMTYECGIRFLADYLNGDTYFKIHKKHHNLDRARNQFKLVADIAEKEAELKAIVAELY